MASNKFKLRAATIVALLTTSLLTFVGEAEASNCNGHCYGRLSYTGSTAYTGQATDFKIDRLTVASPSDQFATSTLWTYTNNSIDGSAFVEVGMAYGYPKGATRYWYYANAKDGSYSESYNTSLPSPTTGANHRMYSEYIGTNTWRLSLENTPGSTRYTVGTVSNYHNSRAAAAGSETAYGLSSSGPSTGYVTTTKWNNQRRSGSSSWATGWPGLARSAPAPYSYSYATNPAGATVFEEN